MQSIPLRQIIYFCSQKSTSFWNRCNVAWPCRPEPSSDRTVLTTVVCSVREFRYQVIWSAQYSFFNLEARLVWVVNVTSRPLYPREWHGTHCIGGWVDSRTRPDGLRKFSPPPGLDLRTVQPVASCYTNYTITLLPKKLNPLCTSTPQSPGRHLQNPPL
jgi:hypothetical protein